MRVAPRPGPRSWTTRDCSRARCAAKAKKALEMKNTVSNSGAAGSPSTTAFKSRASRVSSSRSSSTSVSFSLSSAAEPLGEERCRCRRQ